MMQRMGPYLVPSAVIGLGPWGAGVAGGVEAALRDRSPVLARACPVLALEREDQPGMAELIRAHLKATRLAEVIRALEQEGLIRLDPVVSPATHVYLTISMQDDPRLARLLQAVAMVGEAALELKATVHLVALLDLGAEGRLPEPIPGLPLYVLEPFTSQGLVLDPLEYQAAAVETLVAAAQPGGSQMLGGGGRAGSVGTLGIAWVGWSQAALRQVLARRLAREAVLRCLEAPSAPQPHHGQAVSPDTRAQALLAGLPFRATGPGGLPVAAAPLFGDPGRLRRQPGAHLRRCAAVLDRRLRRWEGRVRQNARAQAAREAEAAERSLSLALAAGPDGFARAQGLLAALAREVGARPIAPPPGGGPRPGLLLDELAKAERLPDPNIAAIALGLGWLLFSLLWWLLHGSLGGWLAVLPLFVAVGALYAAWRPWRIRQAGAKLRTAMVERAEVTIHQACAASLEELDQHLEQRCITLAAELEQATARLRQACLQPHDDPAYCSARGALSFPLVAERAADALYAELQPLVPEAAVHLATAGCLCRWQQPEALLDEATAATERYLAGRIPLDPGQLAARAYGDRLAERLRALVQGLLDWSQPLVALPAALLPEGQRWLLWPEGLPCPPVPSEVLVLPCAISCVAAVTVIPALPAGIRARPGRQSAETSA
jgi:hypothetical protein